MANLLQDFFEEKRQGNPLIPAENMRQMLRMAYDTSPDLAPLRLAQMNLEKLLRRTEFRDPDQVFNRAQRRHKYVEQFGTYPGEAIAPFPYIYQQWMDMLGGTPMPENLFPLFGPRR